MTVARRYWPQILIVVVVLLVWGGTVRYDFVWDDQSFVTELRSIRSVGNIPQMFYRLDAQSAVPEQFVLFRPLRTVQYALLFQLGGGDTPKPWLFHLNNLVWHTLAALLLFVVARQLQKLLVPSLDERNATWFGLVVALGFAINPVVSETVCWVKSLDDIMAAVFVLAALCQLLQPELTSRRHWMAVLFFALAIYSKISAGPFPIVAFLMFVFVRKMEWRKAVVQSVPFFAVALVFAVHNHLVIGRSSQTAPISGSYVQTLIDMLPVVPKYVRLLFGVPPFLIDYSYLKGGHALTSGPVLAGTAVLVLLGAFAVWALRDPRWRVSGLGLIWTGVFLIPVSNLLPMMQYMAERFLYLPLIGWCLAAAAALWILPRIQLIAPVAISVLTFWAVVGWDRSFIWKDNFTLFVRSSQQGVRVQRIDENAVAAILGQPHMTNVFVRDPHDRKKPAAIRPPTNSEEWKPILGTLLQAYELFPEEANLLTALGIAHYFTAQPEAAASFFEKAVHKMPKNFGACMNWGRAALESRQYDKAEQAFHAAIELQPADIVCLRGLARAYAEQDKNTQALHVAEQIAKAMPDDEENRQLLAEVKVRIAIRNSL